MKTMEAYPHIKAIHAVKNGALVFELFRDDTKKRSSSRLDAYLNPSCRRLRE